MFMEDQDIKDIDKSEIAKKYNDDLIDLDSILTPIVHLDQEGAVPEFDNYPTNSVPIIDGVELTEQVDEKIQELSDEIHLRRSTRERRSSTRYSLDEYVIFTEAGEPETYQEAAFANEKKEWLKVGYKR